MKLQQLASIKGGLADCGKNYDYWNGVTCAGALISAFIPGLQGLALVAGGSCIILAAGHLGGCNYDSNGRLKSGY